MHPPENDRELTLQSANRTLSQMLDRPELPLAAGAAQAMGDTLWAWGVLGGKEVGKSTLINALAGAEVVDRGRRIGEGTFQPAAYLHAADADAFATRFAKLDGVPMTVHGTAPESMRTLALIDMPDFDSTFADHVAQVRRVAALLDGVIWVTTPKKVGDLRAAREIQCVLKHRTNFVYVVNKMDWLLAQSDAAPQADMERLTAAMQAQIRQCDPDGPAQSLFAVTARHRDVPDILEFVAQSQNLPGPDALAARREPLEAAATRVIEQFNALRRTLTTPPTAEAAAANKRANFDYQTRVQAAQLLDHYKPRPLLDRLKHTATDERIRETVTRSLPLDYCTQVMQNLNDEKRLFARWSADLFRKRVACWPLLGLIAWPLTLIGTLFSELRNLWQVSRAPEGGDPFRLDALTLDERCRAVSDGVRALLAGVTRDLPIDLPDAETLEADFRRQTAVFAEQQREAVLIPYLDKRPTVIGRAVRWIFPFAVLLWFPFLQPILEGGLDYVARGDIWNPQMLAVLVSALSAGHVLQGLCVSLLILAATVAAVYSVAARDSLAALDRLRKAPPEDVGGSLTEMVVHTIRRPILERRQRLEEMVTTLTHLANNHSFAFEEL